jgi:hypothetical protein
MVTNPYYCLVQDNAVKAIYINPPDRIRLPNGYTRTNLTSLPDEQLRKLGVYPLIDKPPKYNSDKEYIELIGYKIGDKKVIANYAINKTNVS